MTSKNQAWKHNWANQRNVFNKEGSSSIDVEVPSTNDPEMLVWVSSFTDEVQNGRQIAAINTVILKGNQSNETPDIAQVNLQQKVSH